VSFWLARAVVEALKLGAGPTELRLLASVAAALRVKAQESDPTTAPPPRS
jgi:predicted RNA methylase